LCGRREKIESARTAEQMHADLFVSPVHLFLFFAEVAGNVPLPTSGFRDSLYWLSYGTILGVLG
jgi:hypothetical protein